MEDITRSLFYTKRQIIAKKIRSSMKKKQFFLCSSQRCMWNTLMPLQPSRPAHAPSPPFSLVCWKEQNREYFRKYKYGFQKVLGLNSKGCTAHKPNQSKCNKKQKYWQKTDLKSHVTLWLPRYCHTPHPYMLQTSPNWEFWILEGP